MAIAVTVMNVALGTIPIVAIMAGIAVIVTTQAVFVVVVVIIAAAVTNSVIGNRFLVAVGSGVADVAGTAVRYTQVGAIHIEETVLTITVAFAVDL